MGARLKLETPRWNRGNFVLNIQNDKKGEYFSVYIDPAFGKNAEVIAVDVQPKDRHMLLMVKYPDNRQGMVNKDKFLCGHDEKHWFVAPVSSTAATVASAKAALRPRVVDEELERKQVKSNKRNKRKNEAYVRQGEWFFIPRPNAFVDEKFVLKNEPIRRGSGKPHLCQFLTRNGGEGVYVCYKHPNGLNQKEYDAALQNDPSLKKMHWTRMVRNARVMVKGTVTHSDHKTISLPCWHEVLVNNERQSLGLGAVRSAFLD
jgi:hypothetical protein